MPDRFHRLRTLLARVQDLKAAADMLEWDQETYMPPGAADARAQQIATLRKLAHEFFTADEVGTLLDDLEPEVAERDPLSDEAALVRVARRDYEKETRIPSSLVAELAEATARAKQAWRTARAANTYATFAPHLQRIIDLNVRKAEALGYDDCLYDALLDQYEPGMTTATVERVFGQMRDELVPLVHAITEQEGPDNSFLHQPFDPQKQWDFGVQVLRDIGYDFERGRQDRSAHPFTTSFSIHDVRLTTRIKENYFSTAFFGTVHEGGHGLYEQGIDQALDRTLLARGTSLGLHESQSRLWEILVARSRPFWQHYYPALQLAFPDQLGDVSLEAFYRGVNRVQPSLIRVEADGMTYNLHIMLRFELEQAMVEGRVAVDDLPALWNDVMDDYLGLRPDTDANGVLQDIHWSLGAIGYFPTYALGNLMSVQLFEQAKVDLSNLEDQIATGRFDGLLGWLREHVHQWGRKMQAEEILQRVSGQGLSAEPWLAFIRHKYRAIYDGL